MGNRVVDCWIPGVVIRKLCFEKKAKNRSRVRILYPEFWREIIFDPFDSPWRPGNQSENKKPETLSLPDQPYDFKNAIQNEEIRRIKNAMEQCRFNQKKAAEFLGMTYHQLRGYLRKYELTENED